MERQNLTVRLLLVDDDANSLALLNTALSGRGFSCETALGGREALECLTQKYVDVIISDLNMPSGESSLDLLHVIRQKHPAVAFLATMDVKKVNLSAEALKEGADDYLDRPFEMNALVASISRSLEKKRLEREVEDYRVRLEHIELTYDDTLQALGAALDLRDNETPGHTRRVTRYAMEIAVANRCSQEEVKTIERGAYLHDIGKIGVPDDILLKPGKLTEEETGVMQSHPLIGFELVSRIAYLAPAAMIVLTHQERFDGTGYPLSLVGEEIPLGSRIFALADTLDAMMSDRSYRRAAPFVTAREEIQFESGSQFDPEIVKVFLSVPEKVWEDIRVEVAGLRAGRDGMASGKPPGDPFQTFLGESS